MRVAQPWDSVFLYIPLSNQCLKLFLHLTFQGNHQVGEGNLLKKYRALSQSLLRVKENKIPKHEGHRRNPQLPQPLLPQTADKKNVMLLFRFYPRPGRSFFIIFGSFFLTPILPVPRNPRILFFVFGSRTTSGGLWKLMFPASEVSC